MENIVGVPFKNHIMLCGSMFGPGRRCHQLFECNVGLKQPQCNHGIYADGDEARDASVASLYAEYLARQMIRLRSVRIVNHHNPQTGTRREQTLAA